MSAYRGAQNDGQFQHHNADHHARVGRGQDRVRQQVRVSGERVRYPIGTVQDAGRGLFYHLSGPGAWMGSEWVRGCLDGVKMIGRYIWGGVKGIRFWVWRHLGAGTESEEMLGREKDRDLDLG